MKRKKLLIIGVVVLAATLVAVGLLQLRTLYRQYRSEMLSEVSSQLNSIVTSSGRGIQWKMEGYVAQVAAMVNGEEFRLAESAYRSGDTSSMEALLNRQRARSAFRTAVFDSDGIFIASNSDFPAAQGQDVPLGDYISIRTDQNGVCWFIFYQESYGGFYYAIAVQVQELVESSVESVTIGQYGYLFLMDSGMTFFGCVQNGTVTFFNMESFLGDYSEVDVQALETISQIGETRPGDYSIYFYPWGAQSDTDETLVVAYGVTMGEGTLVLGAVMNFSEFDFQLNQTLQQVSVVTLLELAGVLVLLLLIGIFIMADRRNSLEMAILKQKNDMMEELNRQQQSLAHTERLQQLGIMTSGIAHEFNNLLTPIMGQSMLLLEEMSGQEDSPQFESALDIYEASEKAKGIVKRMSDMSKEAADRPFYPVEIRGLLDKTSNLLSMAKDPHIQVIIDAEEGMYVSGDERLLMQALLNLCINACQAMGTEGTLTLAARREVRSGLPYVCIEVSDTGPGIPEDQVGSIYDPFFTTKGEKGTGLGLAICQKIVENHKGTISVSNRPEGGAVFSVRLPLGEGTMVLED